jgi:heat shock protein HslJ
MKKILKGIIAFMLGFAVLGCSNASLQPHQEKVHLGDNSQTSVDWPGTYSGITPCADCEGIKTELVLSLEGFYKLSLLYLGKSNTPFIEQGKFHWDEQGGTMALEGIQGGRIGYRVGENRLIMLDQNGKAIDSKTGAYELQKTSSDAVVGAQTEQIQEIYWKLIGIMGKAVVLNEKQREPYLMLKIENNRVQGFSGCNLMMGSYELKKGNRIHFSKMASTMMACPHMQEEREFLNVLEQVDNYTISEGVLMLHKARMAPLATFEAVYLE